MLPERVYRQNIEQLEKVRGEWEQEHRTTCEVSDPGLQIPQLQSGKYVLPYSRHFMEEHEAMGWGKGLIPSFIHSCTDSPGLVLGPCSQGAYHLALCSGSLCFKQASFIPFC